MATEFVELASCNKEAE